MDSYGFPEQTQYRRQQNYPVIRSPVSTRDMVIAFVLIFVVCTWLFMGAMSGYHAYNEYPGDPTWLRTSRVFTSVLFSPFYLFYIFIKNTVFRQSS